MSNGSGVSRTKEKMDFGTVVLLQYDRILTKILEEGYTDNVEGAIDGLWAICPTEWKRKTTHKFEGRAYITLWQEHENHRAKEGVPAREKNRIGKERALRKFQTLSDLLYQMNILVRKLGFDEIELDEWELLEDED